MAKTPSMTITIRAGQYFLAAAARKRLSDQMSLGNKRDRVHRTPYQACGDRCDYTTNTILKRKQDSGGIIHEGSVFRLYPLNENLYCVRSGSSGGESSTRPEGIRGESIIALLETRGGLVLRRCVAAPYMRETAQNTIKLVAHRERR